MKLKLVSLTVVTLLAAMGCGAPTRSTAPSATGGATGLGGNPASGGSGGAGETGSGGAAGAKGEGGSSTAGLGGTTIPAGGEAAGGTTGLGGATGRGGSSGSGGSTGSAGTTGSGGSTSRGGSGGSTSSGGTSGLGGDTVAGGSTGSGGATGSGGSTSPGGTTGNPGPCDIYESASPSTPCVAAHSTVRALYAAYKGPLYQLRRTSDKTTRDVPALTAGGFVDISVHDAFCPTGTACTISIIYDQSPNHNDLTKAPVATWLKSGANEADASLAKITVGGHVAHGIYVKNGNNPATDVGYRINATKGVAKNDDPEAMYMVLDGTRSSSICCFDYGNVGTTSTDEGDATMEAIYWGTSAQFAGSTGMGSGPWVYADLENGMFAGDSKSIASPVTTTNTSVTGMSYVTAMLKGPSGNAMGIKAGNAQSGKLETKWNGKRPPGYRPMKKKGAIVLGTGGDGSSYGVGTFFEGCMTSGNPSDAIDDAIQANIVAAGYGK